MHKVLEHGAEIIRHHMVPIGMLSEEAQEARNKDCRRFRLNNTRKSEGILTNTDLLTMLLTSSDPIVASFRSPIKKKSTPLDQDVRSLLKCPENLKTFELQQEGAPSFPE